MRKKIKQQERQDPSMKKVVLYLSIVFILISLSLLARVIYLIQQSKYDGKHRFTIAVTGNTNNKYLMTFNPDTKQVNEIIIKGKSSLSPGRILGVPVDGMIQLQKGTVLQKTTASDILFYALTHADVEKKQFTYIDLFRLYLFSQANSGANFSNDTVNDNEDPVQLDKLATNIFNDQTITDEQISIEIVNGTGIDGLGKRLERILQNSGGNIIAISNTHSIEKSSKIYYYKDRSYTLEKLIQLLHYPAFIMQNREMADIKIVIGTDGLRNEIY